MLLNYFPELTANQLEQFQALTELYKDWNKKVNLISRQDIGNLHERHFLHALALTRVIQFKAGTEIMDLGTGGGLPGIPLAIYFPEAFFTLVDSKTKKAKVTQQIVRSLGLSNVLVENCRAEEMKRKFDFIVCRGVARMDKLYLWTRSKFKKKHRNVLPNGLLAMKGGNPKNEIDLLPKYEYTEVYKIDSMFDLEYYHQKYILYVQS